jgi:hypothetical protein
MNRREEEKGDLRGDGEAEEPPHLRGRVISDR